MTRELINAYEGESNVTKVTSDNNQVSYLTQSVNFGDECYAAGATKLNTFENETKHVLFLYNNSDAEVGRYYLGKKLQGKTPEELVEIRHSLCFFKSFNPETGSWVPCVGLSAQEDLSKSAVSFI